MDWIMDHAWQSWLALVLLFGTAEMFSLDLVLLMMAVGAAAGVIAALAGVGFVWQCLIASAVALLFLILVRPPLAKRLARSPEVISGAQGLVGTAGLVIETVTDRSGLVQLDGGPWSARSRAGEIEPGSRVVVTEISGAIAYVEEKPS